MCQVAEITKGKKECQNTSGFIYVFFHWDYTWKDYALQSFSVVLSAPQSTKKIQYPTA